MARETIQGIPCPICGFKLWRCNRCGATGCRHPEGWDVCSNQIFHGGTCARCKQQVSTKMIDIAEIGKHDH